MSESDVIIAKDQTMPTGQVSLIARSAILIASLVFVLMMAVGLLLRSVQGGFVTIAPDMFYKLMTLHGVGMVGAAGLAGFAVMWYFLNKYVVLSKAMFLAFLGTFLIGVVVIIGSIMIGGFGGAWTFLYPLPVQSGGVWEAQAAILFLAGLLLIGVAFLLGYLDVGRALIKEYGSLAKSIGWPALFGNAEAPPPTIVASTAVTIVNVIGTVAGAAIILMSIFNAIAPTFSVDALLAKNLTYFFGHVFINASIYMTVMAVYEIVPLYTGRAWKSSKIFLIGWTITLFMVMAVYPHHLFQDLAMPPWLLVAGQIGSYVSGIPVIAITTLALFGYLFKSGARWDLSLSLLVLGVFGWAGGVIPAIIDGIISVNKVMHNTMWVPGHFHFYLLIGMVSMAFGFMVWIGRQGTASAFRGVEKLSFAAYVIGGLGLVAMFLISGANSVPRRWAEHLVQWQSYSQLATVFAVITVLGAIAMLFYGIAGAAKTATKT